MKLGRCGIRCIHKLHNLAIESVLPEFASCDPFSCIVRQFHKISYEEQIVAGTEVLSQDAFDRSSCDQLRQMRECLATRAATTSSRLCLSVSVADVGT